MREAPSINLIKSIVAAGGEVNAYDPKAMVEAQYYLKDIEINYHQDKYSALDYADALIMVTEWKEFRSPNFDLMKSKMKGDLFIDGVNSSKIKKLCDKLNLTSQVLNTKDLIKKNKEIMRMKSFCELSQIYGTNTQITQKTKIKIKISD